MTNITIRAAVRADLPILREFEQNIIAVERPFNSCLKTEKTCYYDIGELIDGDTSTVMVAVDSEQIVASGYARIKPSVDFLSHDHHAYLGFMFVAETHRGLGLNKLVIESLIDWGKEQGMSDFYLQVYAENAPALAAYKKVGFESSLIEMKLNF